MYANKFCDAGQVPIFRYFEACKDDIDFPNFSQNATNFPISMGPDQIPKKGFVSLGIVM